MGLDMYLRCSQSHTTMDEAQCLAEGMTYDEWEALDREERPAILIGYWCNAYRILDWFTNEFDGGVESSENYPVTKRQLMQLRSDCEFASKQEWDVIKKEQYDRTIMIVDQALSKVDFDTQEVWFRARW